MLLRIFLMAYKIDANCVCCAIEMSERNIIESLNLDGNLLLFVNY